MRMSLAALGWLLAASAASAQDLSCSPLYLVVPYPAGGATDVAARLIAERLEPALKKTVVIENRAGATGNIGTWSWRSRPPTAVRSWSTPLRSQPSP
jgi:tripartite-type tricarboxylate transporter receptor subunit TctC